MRVGLVGAGFMGTAHAAAWAATDAQLIGVIAGPDSLPGELADRHGIRAYEDMTALINDVDVVDVCAPTYLHHELVMAALRARRHVVCEKPLALTTEQGEEMVAASRDAGVALLVGHVVRFFPEYAAAKARVADGSLGEPGVLRLRRDTFAPRKRAGNWFLDEGKSGGLVLDLMIHDFDYARWVAGDVDTVYARSLRGVRPEAAVDHALAILRHRGGAITHVEGSWAYPSPVFHTGGEIACTGGLVQWDSEDTSPVRPVLVDTSVAGDVPAPRSPLRDSPWAVEIRHFLAVIRGEVEPRVTAEDGLEALRIATAAAESIRRGEPVTVGKAGR